MKETRNVVLKPQLQQKKSSAAQSTGKSNEVDIQGTPLSTTNKREDHGMTSSHPDGKTSPVPKVQQNETSLHVTGKPYKADIQGTPLPRDCKVPEDSCHSERRFQGRRKRHSAEARSGSFPRVIYKRKFHPVKNFSLRANQRKSI